MHRGFASLCRRDDETRASRVSKDGIGVVISLVERSHSPVEKILDQRYACFPDVREIPAFEEKSIGTLATIKAPQSTENQAKFTVWQDPPSESPERSNSAWNNMGTYSSPSESGWVTRGGS